LYRWAAGRVADLGIPLDEHIQFVCDALAAGL
jgi:hypothetical protein